MSADPVKPVLNFVRFNRDHDNPHGAAPGSLRRALHSKTLGFIRGQNLSIGDSVNVATSDRTKIWSGTITQSAGDRYGTAWFFEIETNHYGADPKQDDTITVTVTVTTQATPVQTSDPMTPVPSPTTVP